MNIMFGYFIILAITLIILFVLCAARQLLDVFHSWRYERKHRALFESCRKEQKTVKNKE